MKQLDFPVPPKRQRINQSTIANSTTISASRFKVVALVSALGGALLLAGCSGKPETSQSPQVVSSPLPPKVTYDPKTDPADPVYEDPRGMSKSWRAYAAKGDLYFDRSLTQQVSQINQQAMSAKLGKADRAELSRLIARLGEPSQYIGVGALKGDWVCRASVVSASGLQQTPDQACDMFTSPGALYFEKTSGEARRAGYLFPDRVADSFDKWVFLGTTSTRGAPQTLYSGLGAGDTSRDSVGLFMLKPSGLIAVFAGDAGSYTIYELKR